MPSSFNSACNLSVAQQTCQKRALRSIEKIPREAIEGAPAVVSGGADAPDATEGAPAVVSGGADPPDV